MKCKICENPADKVFTVQVLKKEDADYYFCSNCEFLFAGNPYWLNEAYSSSINLSDTGILNRNIFFSKIVSVLIYFFFDRNAKYLDYAGGYGIFTRLMRDIGFDFYWNDLYSKNLLARGFEQDLIKENNFELLTAFEVFEHLEDPRSEINKMLELSDSILFSTEFLPLPIPKPGNWWYYGFEHGQHISFYRRKTLNSIAEHFRLNVYHFSSLHLITKRTLKKYELNVLQKLIRPLFLLIKATMNSKVFTDYEKLKK